MPQYFRFGVVQDSRVFFFFLAQDNSATLLV